MNLPSKYTSFFLFLFSNWQLVAQEQVRPGDDAQTAKLIQVIRHVGAHGKGNREAAAAWKQLSNSDARAIPQILRGMDGADPLQLNWIRAAIDTISQRTLRNKGTLPETDISAFLADASHHPRARRTAFEILVLEKPDRKTALIPTFLNDPSVELRRDAVAHELAKALELEKSGDKVAASGAFRRVLTSARDVDQIKSASTKLKELGEIVDLPAHFGFIQNWHIIGPFDNTNMNGFNSPHPPESEFKPAVKYSGKFGEVGWIQFDSNDEFGIVDLTKALDKHKGSTAYAVHRFHSSTERNVQIRIGSANAHKVWLNGELLTANEVYHLGQEIDQYLATGRLKQGDNAILVKVCQNEQTEEWAQRWQFQLRVCDEVGTAVLSTTRPKIEAKPAAAAELRPAVPTNILAVR